MTQLTKTTMTSLCSLFFCLTAVASHHYTNTDITKCRATQPQNAMFFISTDVEIVNHTGHMLYFASSTIDAYGSMYDGESHHIKSNDYFSSVDVLITDPYASGPFVYHDFVPNGHTIVLISG